VSYFAAVRLFSFFELALFCALLVVWLGQIDDGAKFALGLAHGIGVIVLCVLIYIGALRRIFPWPLLAAAVLLGPVGSTAGFELLGRRHAAGQVDH
jgi:hypothetical protein